MQKMVKSGIVMMSDAVKESVTISKQFMEEANDRVSEVRTKAKEVTVAANEAVNAASTKGKEITRAHPCYRSSAYMQQSCKDSTKTGSQS